VTSAASITAAAGDTAMLTAAASSGPRTKESSTVTASKGEGGARALLAAGQDRPQDLHRRRQGGHQRAGDGGARDQHRGGRAGEREQGDGAEPAGVAHRARAQHARLPDHVDEAPLHGLEQPDGEPVGAATAPAAAYEPVACCTSRSSASAWEAMGTRPTSASTTSRRA
jgi:hypothetical protein